jgi:hypothetical protein
MQLVMNSSLVSLKTWVDLRFGRYMRSRSNEGVNHDPPGGLPDTGHIRTPLVVVVFAFGLVTFGCSETNNEKNRVTANRSSLPAESHSPTLSSRQAESAEIIESSSKCDPNYSPCVPIASDVDCADGPGDGPAYVRGPVRVIGKDIYRLDRDGNGIGCER